ncbi:MAG: hypothetical protein Q7U34_15855 [Anaerolineales bacterium]|nr:hypothetical protein [Anaerolineales bacterium]
MKELMVSEDEIERLAARSLNPEQARLLRLLRNRCLAGEQAETIQTLVWESAEHDRLQCRKDFPFGEEWNGKFYQTKQVRPIFVEEADEIVVVTVYSYYF